MGGRRALLAAAAVALLAGVLLILAFLPEVVRWGALTALRGAGFAEADLRVARVGPGGLVLRDLRIGARPDLRVEEVEVAYRLPALLTGRLESVRLAGATVRATLDEGGLSLGDLTPESEGGGPAGPPALPADRIDLEEAQILIETPFGSRRAAVSARLVAGSQGAFSGELSLEAAADGLLAPDVRIANGRLTIAVRIDATGEQLVLRLPDDRPCIEVGFDALELPGALRFESAGPWCVDSADEPLVAVAWSEPPGVGGLLRVASLPFTLQRQGAPLVTGESPELRLRFDGETDAPGFALASTGGSVLLPEVEVALSGLELGFGSEGEQRLTLHVDRVAHRADPPAFHPLRVDAVALPFADPVPIEAQVRGSRLDVTLTGEHLQEEGRGSARFSSAPVRFAPDGLQPDDVTPLLADLFEDVRGAAEARGTLRWSDEGLGAELDLELRELAFSLDGLPFTGVEGTVHFDDALALRTPAGQRLRAARVDAALPITEGILDFAVGPGARVRVESARGQFAGGVVRAEGLVDLAQEEQHFQLRLEDADLASLAAIAEVSDLSVTGTLAGSIPVVLAADGLHVQRARLTAPPGGRIRYRPPTPPAHLLAAGPSGEIVLQALEDFHYEELTVRVHGAVEGEMEVTLRLRGRNPALEGGRPVDLTLNLSGAVGRVVRASTFGDRLTKRMQRLLEEGRLR